MEIPVYQKVNDIAKFFTYESYKELVKNLLSEGKSTGQNQSEEMTHYSMLNDKRMDRLDKTIQLSDETISKLNSIETPQKWVLITEGWCGDAAQNVPIIAKMASVNPKTSLQIVLRDENLPLMDQFLTNGGRAIPKLIILNDNNEVINTWGPRPSEATKMVSDYKEKHGKVDAELKKQLQIWYNKNKGKNLQKDIISLFTA